MPVCDVCNTGMSYEDGYVLSTRQVATSEAYWEFAFTHQWSIAHSMDPQGDTVGFYATKQAAQSTGWLVCESCMKLFDVDRRAAKEYAMSAASSSDPGTYCPPGGGPISPEEAALPCGNAWKKLYRNWPSSIVRRR